MAKHLTFKGVRKNLTSAWISSPLAKKYRIGHSSIQRHPKLPLFAVHPTRGLSPTSWDMDTGCTPYIDKVLLVEYDDRDVVPFTPHVCRDSIAHLSFAAIAKQVEKCPNSYFGLKRLKVLCEVDKSKFSSAQAALDFYKKKYKVT